MPVVLTKAAGPLSNLAGLTQYQTTVALEDDFLTGLSTSGNIGALGWNAAGTPGAGSAGIAEHPGILNLATGGSSATIARINMAGNAPFLPAAQHSVLAIVRLNHNDANTTVRIGSSTGFATDPPSGGIYFEKLDADTNWFAVTRSAGTQTGTRIDTGIATDATTFHTFTYLRTAAGVVFLIDNVQVVGPLTSNIPTAGVGVGIFLINSAASSKTLDIDYIRFEMVVNR